MSQKFVREKLLVVVVYVVVAFVYLLPASRLNLKAPPFSGLEPLAFIFF